MNTAQPHQPLKAFELINSGTFTTKHLELRQNGATILWINTKSGFLQPTQINLQSQSRDGPIVAAARLKKTGTGCRVLLGSNPDIAGREQWLAIESQSLSQRQYGFQIKGGWYAWKRTHKKELGASGRSGDYKLVNMNSPDLILAVYITDRQWFNSTDLARIEFMMELGREVEMTGLAAILGIAEGIRRSRRAGGAGGAGGAAGGGGGGGSC